MVFFRTKKCKVDSLNGTDNCLEFSISSQQAEILQYVQDPSSVRIRRKNVVALAATLRFLYQEGTLALADVDTTRAPFRIPYNKLYQIPELTLRTVLGITPIGPEEMAQPPVGTFSIRLTSRGEAGQSGFRVTSSVRYKHKNVAPSQIRGPLISSGDSLVLMPEVAWRCIESFKQLPIEDGSSLLAKHYKTLASAQEFARYDYIRTDDFIKANPITAPQSVALSVNKEKDGLICSVHPEGVPKEAFEEVFTRTGENVPDAYSIEADDKVIRVFFEPETREQLRTIARKRRVVGKEVQELLDDPAAFFDLPDESPFWDFTGLSGRIAGWGLFIPDSVAISPAPVSARDSVFLSFAAKVPCSEGLPDGEMSIEEACLTADELRTILNLIDEAIASDRPFLELSNPPIVLLPSRYAAFRQQVSRALKRLLEQEQGPAEPKLHLLTVANTDEVLHSNSNVEISRASASFFKQMELPEAIRPVTQSGRKVQAYPHQADGVSWLLGLYERSRSADIGCLLADDMGLGKTFQVICFLAALSDSGGPGPTLIVCPTTLLKNWASEIKNFVTEEAGWSVSLITAGSRPPSSLTDKTLVITNYEQIYNRNQEFFLTTSWQTIFFDEAQKFKNPGGILHNYLCNLASPFKVAMTGTPVENRLLDLWSIFDVVQPGLLGHQKEFIDTFEVPLRQLAAGSDERRALREELEKRLGAHFLRRTKALLKDQLPPITRHEPTYCQMSPVQRERYGNVIAQALAASSPFITAMLDLLMISSHPAAKDPALFDADEPERLISLSGKLDKTIDLVERIRRNGKKVIIFEKFKMLQQILSIAISTRFGIEPLCINGDVSPGTRKGLVDTWDQTEGFNVLIMSPRTGGAGLTITSANHVIHFTREYNPAVEMQATDRVYRIGQRQHVEVHYPISVPTMDTIDNSIESHLDRIQSHKQRIADDFTMPVNVVQPDVSVDSAGSSSDLSKLLRVTRNSASPFKQSTDRIRVEVDNIFGDIPEWHYHHTISEDSDLTMLRNQYTGEGILIYNGSELANQNSLPQILLAGLPTFQTSDHLLRAIVGRVLVCADEQQMRALSDEARAKGVKLRTVDQLNGVLSKYVGKRVGVEE